MLISFDSEYEISDLVLDSDGWSGHSSLILQGKQKTDTSALDARNGKDIQGIPWERLKHTRDEYRQLRLKQYKNYENLPHPAAGLRKVCIFVFV